MLTHEASQLKSALVAIAVVELSLLALLLYVLGFTTERATVALALSVGLVASHRYFWQRLSGNDAQFFNLVVRRDEDFGHLDKGMIGGHLAAFVFGVSLIWS